MFLARFLSFCLGSIFLLAAVAKVVRPRPWRSALAGYRLPSALVPPAVVGVPIAEAALAGLFFAGATRVAAAVTLCATALFSLGIVRARSLQGGRLPCGCFGSSKMRDYRTLLARNAALAVSGAGLLLYGRDVKGYPAAPSGHGWVAALLVVLGAAVLAWLVAGVRSGLRRGTT